MTSPAATPSGSTGAPFPFYQTSFVGRESEVAALLRALESNRLVTVIGPGGIGKTRLAVESARAWVDANASDALFADLSGASAGSLQSTILRDATGAAGVDGSLVDYLSQGSDLLVLDNCEHVAADVAGIVTVVLRGCPGVRILATSRAPLGVSGEARYPLGPLPTGGTAEDLFLERARLADAALELGDQDRELVGAVCAGLDGVPLGIELAAASLRSLALSDVVARLSQSLDAFESPLRDAPARQRNLRAAIQWSYDLLDEGERLLFQRLAVFSGGWRLDSAEEVCSGEGVERREVLRLHRSLVEQGLVDFNPDKGRYRLLEPIREFAAELLGSDSPWHERHAASFASLAERLTGDFHSPPRDAQARLREEDANLLKAAEWSYRSARLEAGLRIVAASARHWRVRGGSRWLAPAARLTSHPDAKAYGELWAVAWLRVLSVQYFGDARESELIASLRQVAELLAGSEHEAEARVELGLRLAGVHELEEATSVLELGLREAEAREDLALRMHALHGLSEVASRTGNSQLQRRYAEEMLPVARTMDNPFLIGLSLGRLGVAYSATGSMAEAESAFREAVAMVQQWDPGAGGPADAGGPLATLLLLQGRSSEAAEILRATLVRALGGGDMYMVPLLVGGLGIAAGLSGAAGLGTRLLTASLADARRRGLIVGDVLVAQLEQGMRMLERAAGPEVFREETARGEQLSLMDAVELALNETVAPEPPAAVAAKLPAGLTAREGEVLRLLAAGNTNRQIAAQLVLSLRTVETHIFNVYSKTNTGGRAAATGWAIANGIYEPTT